MSLLTISNLSQRFGGLLAVSDFSINLEGGEFMGLIGPNGAGKTTMFNLTSGFYTPSEGEILFKGKSIVGLKSNRIASMGIARTFQNIRLWHDMSVLENIMISQHYNLGYNLFDAFLRTKKYMNNEKRMRNSAMEILEVLDLISFIDEKPRNLPYGIQRKLEIGRALSLKPDLLMLDEPAAGLNSADIQELIKLVGWIHKEFNITIWMIEHQMAVVMSLCSWIKVIDFGVTIAEGTPEHIQNNPAVIKAYLGDDNI
ncbi:MAG: high-affinity branched-chain amino acid ABC transporter ATP-binding protein LivG [Desulfobacteraceae bacterium 4572_19]|nr:MAG: high-affinity branched-chain amino acid ABC transporter ATP-binding protein LivG [Desulfobacteraceae bacterium 4572_19]